MLVKNYKAHIASCKLMYKLKTMTRDDFQDSISNIPSNEELFSMFKLLAAKYDKLELELQSLRGRSNNLYKKNIIDLLENTRKPARGFYDWIVDIEIDYEILFIVFNGDLTEGMKQIFLKKMDSTNIKPICTFKQKNNTFYVYDKFIVNNNPVYKWHIISSNEVEKVLNYFNYEFIKTFLQWQTENEEAISASEDMQDKIIQYMIKINGSKISNEKRWNELKKWLSTKIEEDFVGVEF
jgi:hypothetical protein